MRKFKFKMQAVLDHRKAMEDKLLGELGDLRLKEQIELLKLNELIQERDGIYTRIAGGEFDADGMKRVDAYVSALNDDIKVQRLTLEGLKKQIEDKLQEVIEASRAKKLIEKIREKHLEEYNREMLILEQKALDESASISYARKAA